MDDVTVAAEANNSYAYYNRLKWLQFGLNLILLAISCFGNVLTILSVVTNRHLRQKRNVLIVSLAVADITSLAVYLIITANTESGEYVRITNFNLHHTLVTTTVYISVAHIFFIGFERIIAITCPLHYPRLITIKVIVVVVIAVWLLPTITVIPGYLYAIAHNETVHRTLPTVHYSITVASYLVLTITLCSFYGKILKDAILQANKVHQLTSQFSTDDATINRKRPGKKALKLVISILVCFTLSYCPYALFCILTLCGVDTSDNKSSMELFEVIAVFFVQMNSTVNAGVYAALSKEFRQTYLRILCIGHAKA